MRVVTWNVENLFSPGGEDTPSPEEHAATLETLTGVVAALAPDVLAVQEIGDERALDDLTASLRAATGGDWVSRASRAPDSRGIRVGVLTTRDVVATDDVEAFAPRLRPVQVDDSGTTQDRLGRGALLVTVAADSGPLHVLTAHLKSKLLTYPGGRFGPRDEGERARAGAYALYRRAAEAATLRVAANRVLDGRGDSVALVVAGDMNDTTDAATTQVLQGPPGSEIGTAGERIPDRGDPWRLWNVAPLIPEERRFSRVYRGSGELIDHLLVSRALLERIDGADAAIDVQPGGGLPSVTDDPRPRIGTPGSDHAPVVVDLDW
ncbi:endonuclease/exonuclease/phosphatase family protein [Aquipuribacter nitratireducens]|uniref:Endonuclease/exonuclease/phosphatase family protein n=1 Tax=Aquipuribacter nitratireducens TaxID=650104 RepID=A0ABW0GPH7_9MICO